MYVSYSLAAIKLGIFRVSKVIILICVFLRAQLLITYLWFNEQIHLPFAWWDAHVGNLCSLFHPQWTWWDKFSLTMIQESSQVLFPQCATNISLYIFFLISLALINFILYYFIFTFFYFHILLLIAYFQNIRDEGYHKLGQLYLSLDSLTSR